MKITVFSDKFVTTNNPSGKGVVDLDTPEAAAILGSQQVVDELLVQAEIAEMRRADMRSKAIQNLKNKGKLSANFVDKMI